MDAESRAEKWRQIILENLQNMQSRRRQFSDLTGWRAAIEESKSSDIEQWWAYELVKFEAMLEDALNALKCIPEITTRRVGMILSCSLASGAIREFAVLRHGDELITVRAHEKIERGNPHPILLGDINSNKMGRRSRRLFRNPLVSPSVEATQFIEEQVMKQIEKFLLWVASGVSVERWERSE